MFSVAVLHQKGGSGKTTLACNLASAAHLEGLRTTLIDADTQGSALSWSAARKDGSRLEGLVVHGAAVKDGALPKSEAKIALPRFREKATGFDVMIIDGPARESGITMSAAAFADVVLVPLAPGPTDAWAIDETISSLELADSARIESGRSRATRCFVVNAARLGTVLAREAQDVITELGGVFVGIVHHRVTFPTALSRGESVLTLPVATEAAAEITALWRTLKGAHGTHVEKSRKATPGRSARSRRVALRR
jgi:chromosome partitioning protein